ncbi:MAG: type III-B CRISPR-associated protein Cas10/Cmr2 [Ardenticatenales bacterium]|nr:type III-B CRISPR-associated protein Cas10/Cmr2 [Ardenticatenales bacterium]
MSTVNWRLKIAALLHDGVIKHDAVYYSYEDKDDKEGEEEKKGKKGKRRRGHGAAARLLGQALITGGETSEDATDLDIEKLAKPADLWSSAGDRPELFWRKRVFVSWRSEGRVTHPLCESSLHLLPEDRAPFAPSKLVDQLIAVILGELKRPTLPTTLEMESAATAWHWLWRAQRGALHRARPADIAEATWSRYLDLHPADTRCPDVSLWDHVRMASALSWPDFPEHKPYLFHADVGPVSRWLREARTTRDTWLGSMLLSELSLAAMRPVIDVCGPDAIVYPDLARNLRYDRDLARRPDARVLLTDEEMDVRTRAALIPNRWLAIVPERPGGSDLADLGRRCQEAAQDAWRDLSEQVLSGFLDHAMPDGVIEEDRDAVARMWRAQCMREGELFVHFAAVPWHPAPDPPPQVGRPSTLPAQQRDADMDRAWRDTRRALLPWVQEGALQLHDATVTAWRKHLTRKREGSDYAAWQHIARAALAARATARTFAADAVPPGDACTVCGHRTALAAGYADADRQRRTAGAFWGDVAKRFNWDDGEKERLCGVCATRRFIVPPWNAALPPDNATDVLARFHHVWARAKVDEGTKGLQLPMPSTAAIAAGHWLCKMLTDDDLAQAREAALAAIGNRWPKTHFPRALQVVGGSVEAKDEFTWYEPSMYFPGPRLAELAARDSARAQETDTVIRQALQPILRKHGRPPSRFAVIAVDGDRLGDLLLGRSIKATWRMVLHPKAVARIEQEATKAVPEPWAVAWLPFLDQPRLVGPSLHAFINRALTAFANRIVPWVVEREFGGRLIYAGGDDVLALAPADDALGIAHRLQELWSAPWVHDTRPEAQAWGAGAPWVPDDDMLRFEAHHDGHRLVGLPKVGEIVPMLGPHHSLSAGIAYAHFKTPLGLVIDAARQALKEDAKQGAGRSACAERLFTRGGPKLRSVFQWSEPGVDAVVAIRKAFRDGTLSARMPYKLRGHAAATKAVDDEMRDHLVRGMVRIAQDGDTILADSLARLWSEGIRAFDDADVALGNLLLCRALASPEEDA